MKNYTRLLEYARPYLNFALANAVFNLLYALFNVLSILVFIPTLGILFGTQEPVYTAPTYSGIGSLKSYLEQQLNYFITTQSEQTDEVQALVAIVLLSALIFLLKNVFRYLAAYVLSFLRTGIVKDLQDQLYNKLVELPLSYTKSKRKGDLIARMTSDVKEVEQSIINSFETISREPFTIVLVMLSMFVLSWQLTLFVLLFFPVAGFIIARVGKSLKAQSLRAQQETGVFLSFFEETLGKLLVIKSFTAEQSFKRKFEHSTKKLSQIMNRVIQRNALASPLSEFLGVLVVLVVLWYGGSLVLRGDSLLSPQEFMGYIGLFYTIINPVKLLTTVNYNLKKGKPALERILEIIDTSSPLLDPVQAVPFRFEQEIRFNKVSFGYDNEPILEEFNLTVKKGETLAIVGTSGSGKTTMVQLLSRFYDVNSGSITIDGVDLRDFKKSALRKHIAFVTQEAMLFNESVTNNIALGEADALLSTVKLAAEKANAAPFVDQLEHQYEMVLGDDGNRLSGGQKQRIAIARAFFKDAPILVLDEATSALDTESEREVQFALDSIQKDRTTFIIAHRLSTVQKADRIIVLDNRRIAETGTHNELLQKKGIYANLIQLQTLAT
ncbi:MAG: ABC transporter ATP-binding protein [Flavobacteriaceae bacterium]